MIAALLAADSETVSAYVLRRRFEECARQLSSPLRRGQSITEIAFAAGFNTTQHFARAFRHRYGMTPRQYRELHLASTENSRSPASRRSA